MAPATAGPRPLSAEAATSRQIEVMPQPVNSLATLRLPSHPRLPSGLNAVSSAVMLDRILAVDPEGAVFLSRDATKHWERVPIQWTGKAVSVQAPPRALYPVNAKVRKDATLLTSPVASVSIMPAPPTPAPDAPPSAEQSPATPTAGSASPAPGPPPPPADALAMPGMLFKLINDHHQTWVSADGKVWHQQQERNEPNPPVSSFSANEKQMLRAPSLRIFSSARVGNHRAGTTFFHSRSEPWVMAGPV